MILLFDALPDKATADNMSSILATYERYKEFPRALRALVTNYGKMAELLAQIDEINAKENLAWYKESDLSDGNTPSTGNDNTGSKQEDNTGPVNTGVAGVSMGLLFVGASAAALLLLAGKKRKKDGYFGEGM